MSDKTNTVHSSLTAAEIQSIFTQTLHSVQHSRVQTARMPTILEKISKRIEHTALKVSTTTSRIEQLCHEALEYHFRGVCCLPRHIKTCANILQNTDILKISVVDFPLCGATPKDVVAQAQSAVADGADEIDMVLDVPSLKTGNLRAALDRIAMVAEAIAPLPLKVILETACLTESEIVVGCALSGMAGAAFVKTSTGFADRGATIRDIEIMKIAVGNTMRIKASGGIKDAILARQLIAAGADVIGTSAGPACLD